MKNDAQEIHAIESTIGTDRLDLYNIIHKTLRAWMGHMLTRVGQMDPTDARHVPSIDHLGKLAASELSSPADQTGCAAQELYAALAAFVAENLEHMQIEETYKNHLLWLAYSDAELLEIHRAILGSIPPEKMADVLRWMIPAISAPARALMLGEMQAGMPSQVFTGVLAIAHARLNSKDWTKLTTALKLPQNPGRVDLSRY